MTLTEKNIARETISSSTETIYTATTKTIIKDIHVCNNSASPCYFSLYLVGDGDSADDSNVMFKQWNVPANDFVHWAGFQVLETNETIQAVSETADKITILISGADLDV